MKTNFLQNIVDEFYNYFKDGSFFENDFAIAGVITAGTLTVLRYARSWPLFVWSRLKRLMVYSTTVEESDELYIALKEWFMKTYPNKMRRTKASSKVIETEDSEVSAPSPTYGNPEGNSSESFPKNISFENLEDFFWIWHDKRLLKFDFSRVKLENAKDFSRAFMGQLTISSWFGEKVISNLVNSINKEYQEKQKVDPKIRIHAVNSHGHVYRKCAEVLKTPNEMFFPQKEGILNFIDSFEKKEHIYKKASVCYKSGILLYGKAGSGKTQFARTLAQHTNRDLYVINLAELVDNQSFTNALLDITSSRRNGRSIVIIDDVDVSLNGREDKTGENLGVSFQTLLSFLDGNDSMANNIVIMTTNNIEKLDEAMTRKGRMDLVEEVSYPDKKSVIEFISYFYEVPVGRINLKRDSFDFSMVNIQDVCLKNHKNMEAALQLIEDLTT